MDEGEDTAIYHPQGFNAPKSLMLGSEFSSFESQEVFCRLLVHSVLPVREKEGQKQAHVSVFVTQFCVKFHTFICSWVTTLISKNKDTGFASRYSNDTQSFPLRCLVTLLHLKYDSSVCLITVVYLYCNHL